MNFENLLSWVSKFGFIQTSLEAYGLELQPDVLYDGPNTKGNKMTVEWEVHTYSDRYTDDKQPMYSSDATVQSKKTMITAAGYKAYVFQFYDCFFCIDPKGNKMFCEEDFRKLIK